MKDLLQKEHLLPALRNVAVDGQPVLNASGKRHFIGKFKLATKGNAAGDGSDTGAGGQLFLYVVNSCVALNGWAKRKDNFRCFFFLYAMYQRFDVQLGGANAIKR